MGLFGDDANHTPVSTVPTSDEDDPYADFDADNGILSQIGHTKSSLKIISLCLLVRGLCTLSSS